MEVTHHKSNSGVKKRSSNACIRCRQQKIKCSGTLPCTSCSKRSLACSFDDSTKKVLVTAGYLRHLQCEADRLHANNTSNLPRESSQSTGQELAHEGQDSECAQDGVPHISGISGHTTSHQVERSTLALDPQFPVMHSRVIEMENSDDSSPGTDLINPFAIDSGNYMADYLGRHIHLGTSSNWSFSRRVLTTACERLGLQIPIEQIYFEGCVYQLDWKSLASGPDSSHESLLPSSDYALHLLNTVKFHCGQMFHLFDEDTFMRHFQVFHESKDGRSAVPQVWYMHYLILIALAKLFVARSSSPSSPPGAQLFLAAMKTWPELLFGSMHVTQCVEVLICAALYLQCLDFRDKAFDMMGQAVRKALGQGLHTQISHRAPESAVVQRCRRIWWTLYILDRQMATLMGLPQAIRDDDISAPLPEAKSAKEKIGIEIHVELSRVTADIVNTVYSKEGRMPRKFLVSVKKALESIAKVTDLLTSHLELPKDFSKGGISRFGAYLHLLNHQCICLTTRPLAFSFLDRRLQSATGEIERVIPKGSAQVLLRMCIDSAQQMLQILTALQSEGLLESFLPFDLEAVFIASMVLIMAKTIDIRLLEDHVRWTDMAYSILDDMAARGSMLAVFRKRELLHLNRVLSHTTTPEITSHNPVLDRIPLGETRALQGDVSVNPHDLPDTQFSLDDNFWQDEMTAGQLMDIAKSLDLDGFDWITTSLDGSLTLSPVF